MRDPLAHVGLRTDLNPDTAAGVLLTTRALERGLPLIRMDSWPTSKRDLGQIGTPAFRVAAEGREHVLLDDGELLTAVSIFSGHVQAVVAAADERAATATLARLREQLPPPDPSATHEVTVTFWTYGPHGPIPSWRTIAVPEWNEIDRNYAARTRAGLETLMADFRPAHGGQLVLWHGKAGTGKTYALRALAWEWREWCEFHYIVDPDSFFGQHADYLMNVLLQPTHDIGPMAHLAMMSGGLVVPPDEAGESESTTQRAWKLLMLEDTGELLTPDAKSVIGQGLSRFLNVVDGLIGQGLRVLVLVTTNEEIRTLHPAVARPGRCAANIAFEPLDTEEANAWLATRSSDETVERPTTLASLFAHVERGADAEALPSVGFAPARS